MRRDLKCDPSCTNLVGHSLCHGLLFPTWPWSDGHIGCLDQQARLPQYLLSVTLSTFSRAKLSSGFFSFSKVALKTSSHKSIGDSRCTSFRIKLITLLHMLLAPDSPPQLKTALISSKQEMWGEISPQAVLIWHEYGLCLLAMELSKVHVLTISLSVLPTSAFPPKPSWVRLYVSQLAKATATHLGITVASDSSKNRIWSSLSYWKIH